MRLRAAVLVLAASTGLTAGPAIGDAEHTNCFFGSPTPGFDAIRLDLPTGTSFLTLALNGAREVRGVNSDDNFHLAQGIFVLDAETLELEAFRIQSRGMAPRRALVEVDGAQAANVGLTSPEVPYEHVRNGLREDLPPGSYYVVAFGTDGGSGTPNEFWSAGIDIEGRHACAHIGQGTTFEFDHTDFTGGTQVYAPGAGMGESLSLSFETTRRVAVGLMHAEAMAQSVSSATLRYSTPVSSGEISHELVPFVGTPGTFSFEASYRGYYPIIAIAGADLDLH